MAEPNFQNRTLYHGDNLDFLRGMNSETVHLIATDPPFNKNRDFHATPDSLAAGARFQDRWSWERDVHEEWTDNIIDDWPAVWEVITAARAAYGDDMGAFLCWLGVRLMEMHRVLREDGSLYLHIDHTAHAYVKCMLDAIFGRKSFRNEIVWCYTGPSNTKRWFPRKHDTILFYAKSRNQTFNRDDVRIPYDFETLARRGRIEGKRSIISASVKTKGRRSETDVKSEFGHGKVPEDWWPGIPVLTNQRERTGYPTQKPLALYRRIIEASSNEGDIVLDPFCGCATTPVAAEQLKRQWVGMDIWDGARDIVLQRLQDEWLFTPDEAGSRMFPHVVHVETEPPQRTDDNEPVAPTLRLRIQRPVAPWQKDQPQRHDERAGSGARQRRRRHLRRLRPPAGARVHAARSHQSQVRPWREPHPALRPLQRPQAQQLNPERFVARKQEKRNRLDAGRKQGEISTG